ncbi:M57 family metalloprotease [Pedobacter sp. BG31]|uniref:M57 family metalloprotease n=1 Tax=Pedobacter sp. BG31 TaxID=3349697 RepID=UPI0035F2BAE2
MIKKNLYSLFAVLFIFMIYSCAKKQNIETKQHSEIPESILASIKEMGFNTNGITIMKDGYIVEGDIFLPKSSLGKAKNSSNLIIAKSEQYQTYNLVQNLPRTITISVSNLPAIYSTAASNAIGRYNSLNLKINFQLVSSNGNIEIIGFNEGPTPTGIRLGFGGFPFSGNPFNQIGLNTNPAAFGTNPDVGYITSVIQHEIGHCIGLRHTDYYDRSYSCPQQSGNEGSSYDSADPQRFSGAIQIPGTPASAEPNSFMLACNNGVDRSFNTNDIVALNYLYGYPTYTYSFRVTTMSNTPTYYGLILNGTHIAATISTPPVNTTSTYVYNINSYSPSSTLVVKISSGYIPVSATANANGSTVTGVINATDKTITFSNLNMSVQNGYVSIALKNYGLD